MFVFLLLFETTITGFVMFCPCDYFLILLFSMYYSSMCFEYVAYFAVRCVMGFHTFDDYLYLIILLFVGQVYHRKEIH